MRSPARARLVERDPDRPGEVQHEVGDLAEIALEPGAVDRRLAEAGAKRVVMGAEAVELRRRAAPRWARSQTRIARRPTLSS